MPAMKDPDSELEGRYDFGRNWAELAAHLSDQHLEQACADLQRLVGDIEGKSFLDVGCGSGLHSAAALKLGAKQVHAVDYDPTCVETTKAVLQRFAPDGPWRVERGDALDTNTLPDKKFDVVYSWGVLHHTGDVWRAIHNVGARVNANGLFCVALYLRTSLCGLWTVEKRIYSKTRWLRVPIKSAYVAAFVLAKTVRGGNAISYIRDYKKLRGMEFLVDVDDWLGGYPYESVQANELEAFLERDGFHTESKFNQNVGSGLFGTGCGEWKFRKNG